MNDKIKHSRPVPPFLRWCSATIPAVFDDSLTYYEALCSLWKWLQTNLVDVVNNNATVTNEYIKLVDDLKDYVENYFANLDVQEEIDNKLDEMAADGTLEAIIAQYINGHVYRFFITDDMDENDIVEILEYEKSKIIEFKCDVTFTSTKSLNANTTLLLNNHTLTFDIPTVSEDWTASHGFFNFETTDTFTGYSGNGNIHIIGGTIVGGNCSFAHGENISFEDVHFVNCQNDHIIELAGTKNVTIDNCIFEGSAMASNNKEFIQLDVMQYSFFPWFGDGSAAYDGTLNDYITIKNSTFKTSETSGYIFGKAIGQHSYDADTEFKHLVIEGNTFTDAIFNTIELYNYHDVIIRNNRFENSTYTSGVQGSHIRVREKHNNYIIEGNIFVGNVNAIEMASNQKQCYNWTIKNNLFKTYKYTTNTKPVVQIVACDNAKLINNTFEDYTQRVIQLGTGEGSASTINLYIQSNVFKPKNDTNVVSILAYGGNMHVFDNEFLYDGNTHGQLILNDSNSETYGKTRCANNFISQNMWAINRTFYSSKNDYSEMYDIKRDGYVPEEPVTTLSNQALASNIKYTDFNTLLIGINDDQTSAGQYNFTIPSNGFANKLATYRYRIPAVKSDGSIGSVWFILNVDGQSISYGSSDSSIKLTYVGLINKR